MLMQAIENQIFRRIAPLAVRHLRKPDLGSRDPLTRQVLHQLSKEFQLAPPVTVHISDPRLMAGVWCMMREAYVVGRAGRARREAVAAAVSSLNSCPYCVTVHAGMYGGAGGDSAGLRDRSKLPVDIRAAHDWAQATLSPDAVELASPGFLPQDAPAIFGTAIGYHYLNRLVNVFLGETPVALPGMTSAPGRSLAVASLGFFGRRITRLDPAPGACVGQMTAELPQAFSWAAPDPPIAGGLAHFAQEAERAGREAVPDEVRALVWRHLADWRGEQPALGRGWLEELVSPLDETARPSARLALLSARAAWQVDDKMVNAFQRSRPGDRALLRTVAWASYAAVHRIAEWFPKSIMEGEKTSA